MEVSYLANWRRKLAFEASPWHLAPTEEYEDGEFVTGSYHFMGRDWTQPMTTEAVGGFRFPGLDGPMAVPRVTVGGKAVGGAADAPATVGEDYFLVCVPKSSPSSSATLIAAPRRGAGEGEVRVAVPDWARAGARFAFLVTVVVEVVDRLGARLGPSECGNVSSLKQEVVEARMSLRKPLPDWLTIEPRSAATYNVDVPDWAKPGAFVLCRATTIVEVRRPAAAPLWHLDPPPPGWAVLRSESGVYVYVKNGTNFASYTVPASERILDPILARFGRGRLRMPFDPAWTGADSRGIFRWTPPPFVSEGGGARDAVYFMAADVPLAAAYCDATADTAPLRPVEDEIFLTFATEGDVTRAVAFLFDPSHHIEPFYDVGPERSLVAWDGTRGDECACVRARWGYADVFDVAVRVAVAHARWTFVVDLVLDEKLRRWRDDLIDTLRRAVHLSGVPRGGDHGGYHAYFCARVGSDDGPSLATLLEAKDLDDLYEESGMTGLWPLRCAARHGAVAALKILLDAGVDGMSRLAFFDALGAGHCDAVAFLLSRGFGSEFVDHGPIDCLRPPVFRPHELLTRDELVGVKRRFVAMPPRIPPSSRRVHGSTRTWITAPPWVVPGASFYCDVTLNFAFARPRWSMAPVCKQCVPIVAPRGTRPGDQFAVAFLDEFSVEWESDGPWYRPRECCVTTFVLARAPRAVILEERAARRAYVCARAAPACRLVADYAATGGWAASAHAPRERLLVLGRLCDLRRAWTPDPLLARIFNGGYPRRVRRRYGRPLSDDIFRIILAFWRCAWDMPS